MKTENAHADEALRPNPQGSQQRMARHLRDLRTAKGRRREIIEQVTQNGGFSVFWVTENPLRAKVATEMFRSGELKDVGDGGSYPWHHCEWCPTERISKASRAKI